MVKYFHGPKNNVYILETTINSFMKHNPPYKECIVRCLCLENHYITNDPFMSATKCNMLNKFIEENGSFTII